MKYTAEVLVLLQVCYALVSDEYCPWETFRAKCDTDEIILMESAIYGRMKLGRCIRNDLGYVGCYTDVMAATDAMCSGRHDCEIMIPNAIFDKLQPCLYDLKSYFEAAYSCQNVVTASSAICKLSRPIKVTSTTGLLASIVTIETGCGGQDAPWRIEALPGQHINVTLVDFSRIRGVSRKYMPDKSGCVQYAIIREMHNGDRNEIICNSPGRRIVPVYASSYNDIEIEISVRDPNKSPSFALSFQVIGCPDPTIDEFKWFKRKGDEVTIGCHSSDATWTLVCDGIRWIGDDSEQCSPQFEASIESEYGSSRIPSSLLVAVILIVSVLIGASILLCGVLYIKSHNKKCLSEASALNECTQQTYSAPGSSQCSRHQPLSEHLNTRRMSLRLPRTEGLAAHLARRANDYESICDWTMATSTTQFSRSAANSTTKRDDLYGTAEKYYELEMEQPHYTLAKHPIISDRHSQ